MILLRRGLNRMFSGDQIEYLAKLLVAVGVIAGSATAAWKKGVVPAWRLASNISKILNSIEGIKLQLEPNGGGSMRDAIDRIEARIITHEQRQRLVLMDSPIAIFETDANGGCVYVNRTYSRWTGRSLEDLQGMGWINVISLENRDEVMKEWNKALKQIREFSMAYNMVTINGESIRIQCNAFPMFDSKKNLTGWLGIVIR